MTKLRNFKIATALLLLWCSGQSAVASPISSPSLSPSPSLKQTTCSATFTNAGGVPRRLWRYLGGNVWDGDITINPGQSATVAVADGEEWQIWDTADVNLIDGWDVSCSGGDPTYTFGAGNNIECCQSHGDHDHISAFVLRYVGPAPTATIQFDSSGYGDATYNGFHTIDDLILIEADDRFATNCTMSVNGTSFDVHCSCSQPTNVGYGIDDNGDFVSSPDASAANILFIIEGLSTPDDGWCGSRITKICSASQNDCPCGNDDPNAGCANSTGQGATLNVRGTASVNSDDLVLVAEGLPANEAVLFLMARATEPVRHPVFAGLLCLGGAGNKVIRLLPVANSGLGTVTYGPGIVALSCDGSIVDPAIGCISAGDSMNFQVFYRDSADPCVLGANLSSAIRVQFRP